MPSRKFNKENALKGDEKDQKLYDKYLQKI
jgi:hypothetical protein